MDEIKRLSNRDFASFIAKKVIISEGSLELWVYTYPVAEQHCYVTTWEGQELQKDRTLDTALDTFYQHVDKLIEARNR